MNKAAESKARYDKLNTRQYRLKLNLKTDIDIIEQLADTDNMQGYIKTLIRRDMGASPIIKAALKKNAEGYEMEEFSKKGGCGTIKMKSGFSEITLQEDADGNVMIEEEGRIIEVYRHD